MLHRTVNFIAREHIGTFLLTAYIFFTVSTSSIAGMNISAGLLGVYLLYDYYANRKIRGRGMNNTSSVSWRLPNIVLYAYGALFVPFLIGPVYWQDSYALAQLGKYFMQSMPFFLCFYGCLRIRNWFVAVFIGLIGALVYIDGMSLFEGIRNHFQGRIKGPFGGFNTLNMIMELVLPVVFWSIINLVNRYKNTYKRYILGVAILGIVTVIISMCFFFLAKSRGGLLAISLSVIIVGIGYVISKAKNTIRQRLTHLAIILVLGSAIAGSLMAMGGSYERSYDHERILLWESSYHMWKDYKVLGVGFGNWEKRYKTEYISPLAKEPELPYPHNMVAQSFSTGGTVGGIGFFSFWGLVFGSLLCGVYKRRDLSFLWVALFSCMAIFIHGFVDVGIFHRFVMYSFSTVLGIAMAVWRLRNQNVF